jgi:hypothetical protein
MNLGLMIGGGLQMIVGGGMEGAGGDAMATGGVETFASGGMGAPVGVPAMVGGGALAVAGERLSLQGAVAASAGFVALMAQIAAKGGGGGSSGGGSSYNAGNFRQNLINRTGVEPPNAQAHHVFPQKFEGDFSRLGIDIHDPKFGAWWDVSAHTQNSYAYNQAWEGFFASGRATASDAMTFARQLAGTYGYSVGF